MKIHTILLSIGLPLLAGLPPLAAQPVLTTLYSFDGTKGANPRAGLVQAADGNFYGVAYQGGAYGFGTLFEMTPAGVVTDRHDFDRLDGADPQASLIVGRDGNLYGASLGGEYLEGTVFQFMINGTFTNVASFYLQGGYSPAGPLWQGQDGNFYGVTSESIYGSSYPGTVYQMTPAGVITNLHTFSGTDGASPLGGVVQGPNGVLYGTTVNGGTNGGNSGVGAGTVFSLTTNGVFQSLWSFDGTNGNSPRGPLVFGPDGNLYGTTFAGGTNFNGGTVFRISPAGDFTMLASLSGGPYAGLILGKDGNFYGATESGSEGAGSIFQMTTNGTVTVIYTFDGTQGIGVEGNLVQGADGNLYGTTANGGTNNMGTIFELSLGSPITNGPVILSEALLNGTFSLTWSALAGKEYKVQYNNDLATGEWTDLGPFLPAAGATMSATDSTETVGERYYRVVLMP